MTIFHGILSVLKELQVGKVIIGKQGEESENYKELVRITTEKSIPIVVVKRGDIIKIENTVKFQVLFPSDKLISENVLNNNSLVMKIYLKNLTMMFTGDIEEVAEKELVKLYSNNELKADILKVAHHGSKTSSTIEFLKAVSPKIALIGVGENNKFGHPNLEVIERLKSLGTATYRTDEMGEISIKTNCIKITTMVNNNKKWRVVIKWQEEGK